jgi:hypothetical protein
MRLFKSFWLEILTIGIIGAILFMDVAPNYTWMNTDSDGIHYTYAAQWLYPAHKGSAPLFLLLGNLFLRIPIGTEFWRMSLISVLSGIAACVFLLMIIRLKTNNRWYAVIGTLIYGGSALAISQSTIVESYSLITALSLAVYYFCLKQKWLTVSILIGVSGAVHAVSMLVIVPMLIYYRKELFTWRRLGIMASFLVFYAYVPIANRPPYMWFQANDVGGVFGFVMDTLSTVFMLTGKLAIYDLPKRLLDVGGLLLLNFAIVGIVALFYAFKNTNWRRDLLFWVIAIPTIYFTTDLSPQTYVYLLPTIAFGAIAIGIGLSKLNRKWLYATGIASILLLAINGWYLDIGRTLDPNLSATQYYEVELDKVPDGQILMPYYGWEWAAIYRYNQEYDRNIVAVCIDTLLSKNYQKMLTEQGIKFEDNYSEDRLIRQNYLAVSIAELNENVWTTVTTDPNTYGCKVIKVGESAEALFNKFPNEPPGRWHWKPSSPYGIITGSVEIQEWGFVTISNHNMLVISSMIGVVYLLYTMTERMFKRRLVSAKQNY